MSVHVAGKRARLKLVCFMVISDSRIELKQNLLKFIENCTQKISKITEKLANFINFSPNLPFKVSKSLETLSPRMSRLALVPGVPGISELADRPREYHCCCGEGSRTKIPLGPSITSLG